MPGKWVSSEQEENAFILQEFWNQSVLHRNEQSIADVKNRFLLGIPPAGTSSEQWTEQVEAAWKDPETFTNFSKFSQLFQHVPSLKPIGLAEGLLPQRKFLNTANISNEVLRDLSQYTRDKDLSVSVLVGSAKTGSISSTCSENHTVSDLYSIHSLGKVFTGILALELIRQGIITEDELMNNQGIQVSQSVRGNLAHAPEVLERLDEVTLHQALTHQSGLGDGPDYLPGYNQYIDETLRQEKKPEPIEKTEAFLPFVPNRTAPIGEFHYSNTGMLVAGLSLEYLYNRHREGHPEKNLEPLDYNGLVDKYIVRPSGMSFYSPHPPIDFNYNREHKTARYNEGSPAGGAFTSAEDLSKFGTWLYGECTKTPKYPQKGMAELIAQYGREFCPDPARKTIEHPGDAPSGSAYFSLNYETGQMVVVLNDQRAYAASELGRAIKQNIFTEAVEKPQTANSSELTKKFRQEAKELKAGYMAPTVSSEAKRREKFEPPLQTNPRPPWKPR